MDKGAWPGGRIQAGAGTGHRVTLFNCFVMGTIEDSFDSIFDAFMQAVHTDSDWALVFPIGPREVASADQTVERVWSGSMLPVRCRVHRTVRARSLWDRIMQATYDYAESVSARIFAIGP